MRRLFVRSGGVGDTLLLWPTLQRARARGDQVTLWCRGDLVELFCRAGIRAENIETRPVHLLLLPGDLDAAAALKPFLQPFDQATIFWKRTPATERMGLTELCFVDPVQSAEREHQAAFLMRQAGDWAGAEAFSPNLISFLPPEEAPTRFPPEAFIAPGSGSVAKNWPPENFLKAAFQFKKAGFAVFGLLGPAEVERGMLPLFQAADCFDELLVGRSLEMVFERFRRGALFLGNDAGLAHLAGLSGIDTRTAFRQTNPAIWRPLGLQVTVGGEEFFHPTGCNLVR